MANEHTLRISASYIGPIIELDGQLGGKSQSLIFARNGTGKSFLSRAFRYLSMSASEEGLQNAASDLVSEESPDGSGGFKISRGAITLGQLQLALGRPATADTHGNLFHVFSEEFVQSELRDREYHIDPDIRNTIIVDTQNIEVTTAREALEACSHSLNAAQNKLANQYSKERDEILVEKIGISKNLSEFRNLDPQKISEKFEERPDTSAPRLSHLAKTINEIGHISDDTQLPLNVTSLTIDRFPNEALLREAISKITSPARIAEDVRHQILHTPDFFEEGAHLLEEPGTTNCPFCAQSLSSAEATTRIEQILSYFKDAEGAHRKLIDTQLADLRQLKDLLSRVEKEHTESARLFLQIARKIPSLEEIELLNLQEATAQLKRLIEEFIDTLTTKRGDLHTEFSAPSESLVALSKGLSFAIETENIKFSKATSAFERRADEIRDLRRTACSSWEREFAAAYWNQIDEIKNLKIQKLAAEKKLAELTAANQPAQAKARVATTFQYLLKQMFGTKYQFDANTFSLTRDNSGMRRGPHRTLSDGEKTAIAFCYFIAAIHRIVKNDEDYTKVVLIFDDPVTSMSYDYLFSIAQILKNLRISDNGSIITHAMKDQNNPHRRPLLLILTHSSYFYNICLNGRVVPESSSFTLRSDGSSHILQTHKSWMAPFEHQIDHICEVAHGGKSPDHSTCNAIRSVIEGVGRFCHPNRIHRNQEYFTFLEEENGLKVQNVLINAFSHSAMEEHVPTEETIRLACVETIEIVETFAPGQIQESFRRLDLPPRVNESGR